MSLEIMKQALEALDGLSEPYDILRAQDALRAAIKEAQGDGVCRHCSGAGCVACDARHLPEQEPVAWMHNLIEGNVITHRPADIDRHPERWTALYTAPPPCPTCEALARSVMMDQTSHDIAPRQWQGLTDEDVKAPIQRAMQHFGFDPTQYSIGGAATIGFLGLVKEIEAKLKEKNT